MSIYWIDSSFSPLRLLRSPAMLYTDKVSESKLMALCGDECIRVCPRLEDMMNLASYIEYDAIGLGPILRKLIPRAK